MRLYQKITGCCCAKNEEKKLKAKKNSLVENSWTVADQIFLWVQKSKVTHQKMQFLMNMKKKCKNIKKKICMYYYLLFSERVMICNEINKHVK